MFRGQGEEDLLQLRASLWWDLAQGALTRAALADQPSWSLVSELTSSRRLWASLPWHPLASLPSRSPAQVLPQPVLRFQCTKHCAGPRATWVPCTV